MSYDRPFPSYRTDNRPFRRGSRNRIRKMARITELGQGCSSRPHRRERIETGSMALNCRKFARSSRPHRRERIETALPMPP